MKAVPGGPATTSDSARPSAAASGARGTSCWHDRDTTPRMHGHRPQGPPGRVLLRRLLSRTGTQEGVRHACPYCEGTQPMVEIRRSKHTCTRAHTQHARLLAPSSHTEHARASFRLLVSQIAKCQSGIKKLDCVPSEALYTAWCATQAWCDGKMFEKMVVGLLKEHLGAYVKVSRGREGEERGHIQSEPFVCWVDSSSRIYPRSTLLLHVIARSRRHTYALRLSPPARRRTFPRRPEPRRQEAGHLCVEGARGARGPRA